MADTQSVMVAIQFDIIICNEATRGCEIRHPHKTLGQLAGSQMGNPGHSNAKNGHFQTLAMMNLTGSVTEYIDIEDNSDAIKCL
jgi:hypothetical protein